MKAVFVCACVCMFAHVCVCLYVCVCMFKIKYKNVLAQVYNCTKYY